MSARHTEGPWSLVHKAGSNFAVQRFEIRGMFAGHPHSAPIFNKDTSAIDGTTICCSPADARLISAAPDLLAALQGVIRVADRATVEFDTAHAAIFKATGSPS
jgi:hypothetical protein